MHPPQLIAANGGWCWFQDPRAIVVGDRLIVGSVAAKDRAGARPGDVRATALHLASGDVEQFTLAQAFEANDHVAPAFLELPCGRILASYTRHHKDNLVRWRVTSRPCAIDAWEPERSLDVGARATYANLLPQATDGDRIYNLHRGRGFNPNILYSDDCGRSFTHGGRLLDWPRPVGDPVFTGIDGGRPYVKYASNGRGEIHFVTTEDHPWAYDNGIYHGYIKDGAIHGSSGGMIGTLDRGVSPKALTPVFKGDRDNVAWTISLCLDSAGRPVTLFSVQRDGAASRGKLDIRCQDHRYFFARWTGGAWQCSEIAHAGTSLGEVDDYTGLAAIDPSDPNAVVISTNAHPESGLPLVSEADGQRHHELYEGRFSGGGPGWSWTPLTANSTADNIRPVIPARPGGRRIVLWLRGGYRTWTDYDLDVVAGRQERD